MTTTNTTVLKIMNVLFWIIFIGLCIKTGALLTAFLVSLFINPDGAKNLYMGLDLSELQAYSELYYVWLMSLILALSGLKAYIAYLVVKIFLKFDLSKPFSFDITALVSRISYVALNTGVVAIIAGAYSKWLSNRKEIDVPTEWGEGEILFFAGVLYIIAVVFKKGTELQTENDLTV